LGRGAKQLVRHQADHNHRRIECYHQLRSTIAQVNGKKEIAGRTDLDVDISNQCGWQINPWFKFNPGIIDT